MFLPKFSTVTAGKYTEIFNCYSWKTEDIAINIMRGLFSRIVSNLCQICVKSRTLRNGDFGQYTTPKPNIMVG